MGLSQCDWKHADRDDRTVLWLMIAGIVIGTYLAIVV